MNPLLTTDAEAFKAGNTNLDYFRERLVKITNGGALMYCTKGEADITIDLQKYHIVPHTHIISIARLGFLSISG